LRIFICGIYSEVDEKRSQTSISIKLFNHFRQHYEYSSAGSDIIS